MKLITRDTDYAVRALCYSALCADRNKKISAGEIVRELKIPRPFLRKILQQLNKKGILRSYKGKGGGFELALPPEKLYLTELIKIFQGPLKLNECFFKNKVCPDISTCCLSEKIGEIENYVIKELKGITIALLLKKRGILHGKKKDH